MDKIQYRVWDKRTNQMHQVAAIHFGDDGSALTIMASLAPQHAYPDAIKGSVIHGESGILMQFTGRLDTNGNEIYDGDYLANEWSKYRVYWDRGGFVVQSEDGIRHNIGDIDVSALKVIGNRCENPEITSFFAYLEP